MNSNRYARLMADVAPWDREQAATAAFTAAGVMAVFLIAIILGLGGPAWASAWVLALGVATIAVTIAALVLHYPRGRGL